MMKRPAETDQAGLLPNRACRNCVHVKVKCIPLESSPSDICQRCHRLGRTCTTPAPLSRKARAKSTRVVDLEQRVNQLTALLTPTTQTSEESGPTTSQGRCPVEHSAESSETNIVDFITNTHKVVSETSYDSATCQADLTPGNEPTVRRGCPWTSGAQPVARSGSPSMFIPHAPGRRDGSQLANERWTPVYLEPAYEKKLFQYFRDHLLPQFPFVVIKKSMSPEAYKEKRPFSYWAGILAASNRDRMLHTNMHDEMMKALGHRMFVACAKNIDLLQGLLLLIAWHHWIAHYSPQLMNLLHAAQALLADLGIGKPIRLQDKIRLASDTTAMMHGTESLAISITAEEQRALLACYCISSKSALTFNRIDPMKYSQHIDDCCKKLKDAAEYKSDALVVELVQLHRVLGKYCSVDRGTPTSAIMYKSMFEDEIQRYRENLPSALKDHEMLDLELWSGSLAIFEPNYVTGYSDKMEALNAFHACIDAGNHVTKILTSISSQEWGNRTFMVTMSMIQLMVIFCRLSFFKSDKWEIQFAWRTVNFGEVLQKIKEIFEGIHRYQAATLPDYQPWRYGIYAKKAEHIRTWFEAKVACEEAALAPVPDQPIPNAFGDTLFGNFDDSTWQDLMGDWANF